jgi:serine O-acetyltransferase
VILMRLFVAIRLAWYLPLELLARRSPCWPEIERDALAQFWHDRDRPATHREVLEALTMAPVRTLTYHRLETGAPAWRRVIVSVLKRISPGSQSLEIVCDDIGGGLMLPHGFADVLHARRIGRDCLILQCVTLGRLQSDDGYPTIGNRVEIGAGASILGSIHVGDGSIIGANAVVLTDVPPDSVAAGVPARVRPGAAPGARVPRRPGARPGTGAHVPEPAGDVGPPSA